MTDTRLAPPVDATTVPRRTWLALAVLILGVSMALIDTTIVNVAIPTIRTSLDASEATLSWIISGYALAYGLALIPAGRLGDRIGHRWVFLIGILGFTLASIACGLAQDETQLIVARVAQGMFGGIFFPPITALVQLMFPPRVRGKAFAITGAIIGISTALGPLIGGVLIEAIGEESGWRSIFFVNIPFGILALLGGLLLLPKGAVGSAARGIDLVGLVLLAGSLVAILVPLIQGQDEGWPLWTYLSIAGGVIGIVLFAFWELGVVRRGSSPLVPPRLFTHPSFTAGVILAMVYFAAFTSIFFSISIFWQAGLGHTALESGLVSVPFAIGSIIGASQSGRLAARLGRTVLIIGTACVAAGLISLWLVLQLTPPADITNWELLVPLLVGGIGSGLFIAPNTQFIVATVDREEAGAASGVLGTVQRIGSAIGIAVIGSVLFGNLVFPTDHAPTADDLATTFGHATGMALLVSACFAVAAFALVWALPKKAAVTGGAPDAG